MTDQSEVTMEESDHIRKNIQELACACLDHVRLVRWGTATSEYTVTDGALLIDISIQVKCYRKSDKKP